MLVLMLSCTMATLWGDSPVRVNTPYHTFYTHYTNMLVTCCHKHVSTTVTHAHETKTCIHTINVFCCLNVLPPAFSDTLQPLHKPMENPQALVLHNMYACHGIAEENVECLAFASAQIDTLGALIHYRH